MIKIILEFSKIKIRVSSVEAKAKTIGVEGATAIVAGI